MTHLKALIAAIAICALIGPATAASATELDNSSGMVAPESSISAENEGSIKVDFPIGEPKCEKSSLAAKTSNTGGPTETVKLSVTSFASSSCSSGTMTVLSTGTLEVHTTGEIANNNGTVTSSGLEFTVEFFGAHCIFRSSNTHIGTLTGSATTNGVATVDFSAAFPRVGGRSGAFCGIQSQLTGSYKFTEPTTLNVT